MEFVAIPLTEKFLPPSLPHYVKVETRGRTNPDPDCGQTEFSKRKFHLAG